MMRGLFVVFVDLVLGHVSSPALQCRAASQPLMKPVRPFNAGPRHVIGELGRQRQPHEARFVQKKKAANRGGLE